MKPIYLYLGKKEETEFNLGESVVLKLSESLRDTYCTLYLEQFFEYLQFDAKLFDYGIYGIGTVRSNRKMMPELLEDKSMKCGDVHFQYSDKIICVKWKSNCSVVLLGSNIDGADDHSSVSRRAKA